MPYLRSWRQDFSPSSTLCRFIQTLIRSLADLSCVGLFLSLVLAQERPPAPQDTNSQPNQMQAETKSTVTIPAGTRLALVLTQPIQSRYVRRGDDMYAQVTSPVDSGTKMVIPPGTFVQGTIDRVGRESGRGELHLTSMTITFPDGYVAPIAGPITLRTDEGYAIKDPGKNRAVGAFALPAAGVGLGALIGHSAGKADSSTTSPFPPGCVGPPPFCTAVTTPVFGTKGRDTVIGAGVGGAVGMVASMTLLFSSRHFYVDAGAPIQMTLSQPVTLSQDEVAKAVQQSGQGPVAIQPVAPRLVAPPPPDNGPDITPPNPGTPPTVIPGTPGPDGVPGPPTVIPGTPPGM
jgi:hypothetical protein